jgi:hypothetical protein
MGQRQDSFSDGNWGQSWASGGFADPTTDYYSFFGSGKLKPWGYLSISLNQLLEEVSTPLPGQFVLLPEAAGCIYQLRWDIPVVLFVGLQYNTIAPADPDVATCPSYLEVALWEYDQVNFLFNDTVLRGNFNGLLMPRDLSSQLGGTASPFANTFERLNSAARRASESTFYMDFLSVRGPGGWGTVPTQSPLMALSSSFAAGFVYGGQPALSVRTPGGINLLSRKSPGNVRDFTNMILEGGYFPFARACFGASIRIPAYVPAPFDTQHGLADAATMARTLASLDWDVQFYGQLCRVVRKNNWACPMDTCQPLG